MCARPWELSWRVRPRLRVTRLSWASRGGEAGGRAAGPAGDGGGDRLWPGAGLGEAADVALAWTWGRSRCADRGPGHAPGRYLRDSLVASRLRRGGAGAGITPCWVTCAPSWCRRMLASGGLRGTAGGVYVPLIEYGPGAAFPGVIGRTADESTPAWPAP